MKITSVPIEAYRQAGDVAARKAEVGNRSADAAKESSKPNSITLPGKVAGEVDSLKIHQSPALLQGVLSPEEKNVLIQYFARFGDSMQSTQLYNPGAKISQSAQTGLKVDFKG